MRGSSWEKVPPTALAAGNGDPAAQVIFACLLGALLMMALLGCGSFLPTSTPRPSAVPTPTWTPWPTPIDRFAPTPTPTPAPTPTPLVYQVKKGDTLLAIAIRFDVSVEDIMEANALKSAHRLSVGQKLVIPRPDAKSPTRTPTPTATITPVVEPVTVTHVVREGETLEIIARHYFVTVEALLDSNPGVKPDSLREGQVLVIPLPNAP